MHFTPFDNDSLNGVIFSTASFYDSFGKWNTVLAATNLHSDEVSVSGKFRAEAMDGSYGEEMYVFADSIGPGNTFITVLPCGGVPSGNVHCEGLKTYAGVNTYVPWESDWAISGDAGHIVLTNTLYSANGGMLTAGDIYGLGLDADGNILYVFHDYNTENSSSVTSSMDCYNMDVIPEIKSVAFFANPLADKTITIK